MTERFDVAIVGGGPAGSVCSSRLVQRGLRVVVLEKETFPRFRLGESLLPRTLPVLAEIGVLDAVATRYMRKYGAQFHHDVRPSERFCFQDAFRPDIDHAYQVPRDDFDHLLLRHAASLGADVREATRARILESEKGQSRLEATNVSGSVTQIEASFVVDASGRDAVVAHGRKMQRKIAGLERTAFFAHFDGVSRRPGNEAGDIDIILLDDPSDAEPQWLWIIPFKDGRTSVGAVLSRNYVRAHRSNLGCRPGHEATAFLDRAIASSHAAKERLAGSTMAWSRAEAAADFSYRVERMFGSATDRWLVVGDAGGFIDPLFSTGVHLAIAGASSAADAIVETLGGDATSDAALTSWQSKLTLATDTFMIAVQAFYTGKLATHFFAENKHSALRCSITSLLAGDVFRDSVWLRDTRRRIAEMSAQL